MIYGAPHTTAYSHINSCIHGMWVNPETMNQYIFNTEPGELCVGILSVIQQGTDIPVKLSFHVYASANQTLLEVEGSAYDISMEETEVKTLHISVSPSEEILLVKI